MKPNKDINKPSFKLDNLEKRNIYTVPDRYFDELPSIIQAKAVEKKPFYQLPAFNLGLKLALPTAFVLIFVIYSGFFKSEQLPVGNFDTLISEVTTEDLVAYLGDSDISTQEIIDYVSLDDFALESMIDETDILINDDLEDTDINEMIDDLELYEIDI